MAYVSSFAYDIFISYARFDNDPIYGGTGWVDQFVNHLRRSVRQRLGDAERLEIFFDTSSLRSNDQLDQILEAVGGSATFVAIASPSYAKRDWTRQELDAFISKSDRTKRSRLFVPECLKLVDGDVYPSPIDTHNRVPFWQVLDPNASASRDMPLDPASGLFLVRINRLAAEIADGLSLLRAQRSRPVPASPIIAIQPIAAPEPKPAPVAHGKGETRPGEGRTVLLAQVTEDLELEYEQLRSYLEQFGHHILPEHTYPQGGEAFRNAFVQDAAVADIVVQLLGPNEGRVPPDLGASYPRFQAEILASMGKKCLRWRRPDLQLGAVRNESYRQLLDHETVAASGLEAFKTDLIGQMRVETGERRPLPEAMVFINADDQDLRLAQTLQSSFEQRAVPTILPLREGQAAEIRTDLEENYVDCDVVVFIYGSASPSWVRGQLRLFNKVRSRREKPPKSIAIIVGPPVEKPDLGIKYPGAIELTYTDQLTPNTIQDIVNKVIN